MVIYFLLATVVFLFVVSYFVFDKDIMSPSVILCAVYILSILCAIYNIEKWGIDYHWSTYGIIVLGLIIFFLVSFAIYQYHKPRIKKYCRTNGRKFTLTIIEFSPIYLCLVVGFVCVTSFLYIKNVFEIAAEYGANMQIYSSITSTYRSLNYRSIKETIPFWVSQLQAVSIALGYLFLYFFINNTLVEKKLFKNLVYCLPMILVTSMGLLSAERTTALNYFISILIMFYILIERQENWKNKVSSKFVFWGGIAVLLFFVFFTVVRTLVGRNNDFDPLYYITFYAGGSIQAFDLFVQNPLPPSKPIGHEVFLGLYNYFAKFGGMLEHQTPHQEFQISNGVNIGNIYTAFRKYYRDFGLLGVIFFQGALATIFTTAYNRIKMDDQYKFGIHLILFSYFYIAIFKHSIHEEFFSMYLTLSKLKIVTLIVILYWVFMQLRLSPSSTGKKVHSSYILTRHRSSVKSKAKRESISIK